MAAWWMRIIKHSISRRHAKKPLIMSTCRSCWNSFLFAIIHYCLFSIRGTMWCNYKTMCNSCDNLIFFLFGFFSHLLFMGVPRKVHQKWTSLEGSASTWQSSDAVSCLETPETVPAADTLRHRGASGTKKKNKKQWNKNKSPNSRNKRNLKKREVFQVCIINGQLHGSIFSGQLQRCDTSARTHPLSQPFNR